MVNPEAAPDPPREAEQLASAMLQANATVIGTYLPGDLALMWRELAQEHWVRVEFSRPQRGSRPSAFMRFGRAADGRICCTGLLVGGEKPDREVSGRVLRGIPLQQVLVEARRRPDYAAWWLGQGLAAGTDGAVVHTSRPGPHGHPRAHFEQVAAAYREAIALNPRAPISLMCERFRTPEGNPTPPSTVRRWLQLARAMGLLAEAPLGKAGEVQA